MVRERERERESERERERERNTRACVDFFSNDTTSGPAATIGFHHLIKFYNSTLLFSKSHLSSVWAK
jgi:hypothetical protein